jgi:hypothetical protein
LRTHPCTHICTHTHTDTHTDTHPCTSMYTVSLSYSYSLCIYMLCGSRRGCGGGRCAYGRDAATPRRARRRRQPQHGPILTPGMPNPPPMHVCVCLYVSVCSCMSVCVPVCVVVRKGWVRLSLTLSFSLSLAHTRTHALTHWLCLGGRKHGHGRRDGCGTHPRGCRARGWGCARGHAALGRRRRQCSRRQYVRSKET